MSRFDSFKKGVMGGIPIALGYLAVSFSLGLQARQAGMDVWAAVVMSLTNLTSAGEFAALTIIASGAGYLELALSQVVINLRYMLMSFALSQKVAPETGILHRMGIAFGVTDEIFGISIAQEGKLSPFFSYGAMAVAVPGWTIGTGLGVIFGNILPAVVVDALNLALYSMFIAIFLPPAKKDRAVAVSVITAMLLSTLFTYAPYLREISPGMRTIILTVAISFAAAVFFPIADPEDASDERKSTGGAS